MVIVASIIDRRTPKPPELSANEEQFLKIIEALRSLDTYFDEKIEFSRIEASKNLSKVEKRLSEPSSRTSVTYIWGALTRDVNEGLRLLKRNLNERLLPSLSQDNEEELRKAYSVIEELAGYFLDPEVSELNRLNQSLSNLPSTITTVAISPSIPYFQKHPKAQHIVMESVFALAGSISFLAGTSFFAMSSQNAFNLACMVWATLTAGYVVIIFKR